MFVTVCSFNMGVERSYSQAEVARLENVAEVYLLQDVPKDSPLVERLKEKGFSVHSQRDSRYLVILSKRFKPFGDDGFNSRKGYCKIQVKEVGTGKIVLFVSAFFTSGNEGLTKECEDRFFNDILNNRAYGCTLRVVGGSADSQFETDEKWNRDLPNRFESNRTEGKAFVSVEKIFKRSWIEQRLDSLFSRAFVVPGFEKSPYMPVVTRIQMQGAGSILLNRISRVVAFLGAAALGLLFYTGQITLVKR